MNLKNRVNDGDRNFHDMLLKELEWGINTDTNTFRPIHGSIRKNTEKYKI